MVVVSGVPYSSWENWLSAIYYRQHPDSSRLQRPHPVVEPVLQRRSARATVCWTMVVIPLVIPAEEVEPVRVLHQKEAGASAKILDNVQLYYFNWTNYVNPSASRASSFRASAALIQPTIPSLNLSIRWRATSTITTTTTTIALLLTVGVHHHHRIADL